MASTTAARKSILNVMRIIHSGAINNRQSLLLENNIISSSYSSPISVGRRVSNSASRRTFQTCTGATTEKFLKNRVALVTGSTSGIGLGVARALAARGCQLILNGFGDEALITSLQKDFQDKYKSRPEFLFADLTSAKEVEKLAVGVKNIYPKGVDILVNNAGFQHVSKVEEFPVEKWDALIAVLLSAPFHLIRTLLPDMIERKWGRIINLASVHSVRASPFKAAYVSAKHGLAGLTKVVALETAGSGVTCNAVSPGYVDTPISQLQIRALADKDNLSYDEAKVKFLSNFHPSKEAVGIDHIAEMFVFLCSDAASQMTGSNLIMDGGWCAK